MDDVYQLLSYSFALGMAALIPGPGMTGLMFKTLTHGTHHSLVMLSGLITGDLIFLSCAALGLTWLGAFMNSKLLNVLIIASCMYLLWLAWQFWSFKGNLIQQPDEQNSRKNLFFQDYRDGLLLTLSNPKTISFYLALLPSISGAQIMHHPQLLYILFPLTMLILLMAGSAYIWGAMSMKRILSSQKIQHKLLKAIALLMAILALSLLYRQWSVMLSN